MRYKVILIKSESGNFITLAGFIEEDDAVTFMDRKRNEYSDKDFLILVDGNATKIAYGTKL